MKGFAPAQAISLEEVAIAKKAPGARQKIQGEMDSLFDDLEDEDEYGAEGYTQNRHTGFGSFMKKAAKTVGKVGLGIGRVMQPELAPLYDAGDNLLDKIKGGGRLGQDPSTWGPHTRGQEFSRQDAER